MTGNEQWQDDSRKVGELIAEALAMGYAVTIQLKGSLIVAEVGSWPGSGETVYEALNDAMGHVRSIA